MSIPYTTTFVNLRLRGIVAAKRDSKTYEIIDNNNNILFLVKKSDLKRPKVYRWTSGSRESSWYDRLWICVNDGVNCTNGQVLISRNNIIRTISENIVYFGYHKNTVSIEGTAKKSGFSPYLVRTLLDEVFDYEYSSAGYQ